MRQSNSPIAGECTSFHGRVWTNWSMVISFFGFNKTLLSFLRVYLRRGFCTFDLWVQMFQVRFNPVNPYFSFDWIFFFIQLVGHHSLCHRCVGPLDFRAQSRPVVDWPSENVDEEYVHRCSHVQKGEEVLISFRLSVHLSTPRSPSPHQLLTD